MSKGFEIVRIDLLSPAYNAPMERTNGRIKFTIDAFTRFLYISYHVTYTTVLFVVMHNTRRADLCN